MLSLKILFLTHKFYPDIGGIEANSEILTGAFYEAGHQVHVITWSENAGVKSFPYPVIRNPSKKKLFREHAWADVVFENNPCLRLAWPNLFFARPSVIALNTWVSRVDGKIGLQDQLKHKWLKKASKVIAVSDAVRKRCRPDAIVITNPYQTDNFKIIPEVSRDKSFVFLGRLVSDKGADQAINAIHGLLAAAKENGFTDKLSLTIIGDGPEKENLQNLVSQLHLNDVVYFAGSLRGADLAVCLNQHRFILVPSVWEEPFGNVALEGMACGCLPIVSDGGGLPDAIGKAGITYRRGDVNDLMSRIRQVLSNSELEQQLRGEAAAHLLAHHPDKVSNRYLKVIESAINQPG